MLVLVNPNNRTPAPYAAIEPPLWLGLIAGYRMSQGDEVQIVDAEAEGLTIGETVGRVNALKPDETIIVVMGNNPSASSTPKMPITEELLKHIDAKITGLHPIAVKDKRCIVKPFEGCPQVPWELLPLDRYIAHNWHCLGVKDRGHYGVLYTSLNCPFDCYYCNVHTLYGDRKVTYRPMEDIYSDLDTMYDLGVRNLKIWDELFCNNPMRVNAICEYIIENGYSFNIWAYARVDTVTEDMVDRMKQAGINWLGFGFESADIDVRRQSHKGFTDAMTRRTIDLVRQADIAIMGNFIFGLPGDTLESMQASLDMAIEENFEYVNFYVGLPYPGSAWYKGDNTDWSSYSQFSPNICADKEVVEFRDKAFNTYFNRPEYFSLVRSKFGDKAENHIKEMLKWQLR